MSPSNDKTGPRMDEAMKRETEDLERAGKESHVEEDREVQGDSDPRLNRGHRVSGSGSSADTYPWRDHGEKGGASHPKLKE